MQSVEEAVVRFRFDLISTVRTTMLDYDYLQEVVVVVPQSRNRIYVYTIYTPAVSPVSSWHGCGLGVASA